MKRNAKFTRDFLSLGKQQEKKPFTTKPKLNKPLAMRNMGPKQTLLKTIQQTQEKLEKPEDNEEA
jgi:hypothetical protein